MGGNGSPPLSGATCWLQNCLKAADTIMQIIPASRIAWSSIRLDAFAQAQKKAERLRSATFRPFPLRHFVPCDLNRPSLTDSTFASDVQLSHQLLRQESRLRFRHRQAPLGKISAGVSLCVGEVGGSLQSEYDDSLACLRTDVGVQADHVYPQDILDDCIEQRPATLD